MIDACKRLHEEGNARFPTDKVGAEGLFTLALISLVGSNGADSSEKMASLFSNRSACRVAMNEPDLALADAERARELRPAWYKAYYRLGTSYAAMDRVEEARQAFRESLSLLPSNSSERNNIATYVSNPHLAVHQPASDNIKRDEERRAAPPAVPQPFAQKICIQTSPVHGYGVFAKRAIKKGEIVLIETPLFSATLRENTCATCCASLDGRKPFHCVKCYREAYCSEACVQVAEEWHVRECSDGDDDDEASLADRLEIFKVALEQIKVSNSECLSVFAAIRSLSHPRLSTVLAGQYCMPKELADLHELHDVRHSQFSRVVHVLGLPVQVRGNPPHDFAWFKEIWCKVTSHYFDISTEHDVCALLEYGAYFNHNCTPSVTHHPHNGKVVFVAEKHIREGEELFVTYANGAKDATEEYLAKQYGFECTCPTCRVDYSCEEEEQEPEIFVISGEDDVRRWVPED